MKVGRNCKISDKVSVYGGNNIEIGDNTRIDDFCILSGGGGIKIGSHIHIAPYCSLFGGSGIIFEDFVEIAAYNYFTSESDDFFGHSLVGPQIPQQFKPRGYKKGQVILRKHVLMGARCVVFPGVEIGEGVSVGACSLVTKDLKPWTIYAGIPVKPMGNRSQDMLKLEEQFLKWWEVQDKY